MKILKSKTIATLITLLLVLTITFTLLALPSTTAHTPPWTDIPTYAYVAPSPDVIGVGQQMVIIMFIQWIPPTSFGKYGDRWIFYLDITKPDGTNETIGPLTSDSEGGMYSFYTPDQLGVYSVVCRFPGQKITGYPTPTGALSQNAYVNDTFAPSTSRTEHFTVQQEPIPSYQDTPLPNDYWTRPIYDANRGWGNAVMGQWLGGAYYETLRTTGIPNQSGPLSSHILWTRSEWSGGVEGGFIDRAYYNGIAYEGFSSPQVILDGRAYYPVMNNPRQGWYCIDFYTGETLYFQNNTNGQTDIPTMGQVLDYNSPNQFGGFPYLWRTAGVTVPAGSTSTTTWEMLDGFSGNAICKIANVSATGTQFRDSIGSICYFNFANLGTTAAPNYYMQIWNTTQAIWWRSQFGVFPPATLLNGTTNVAATVSDNSEWFWRPGLPGNSTPSMSGTAYGAIYDGRYGYSMNVSVASIYGPRNSVLNQTGSIQAVVPEEYVIVGAGGQNDARGLAPGFLKAYSIAAPTWGQTLWDITFTPPKADLDYPNSTYSGGISFGGVDAKNGFFRYTEQLTGNIWVYSLSTGQLLWKYEYEAPFYYYGTSLTFHGGKAYTISTTGVLIAFDAATGEKLWNWSAPSIGILETEGLPHTPLSLAFFVDDQSQGRNLLYLHASTGWAGQTSPIRRDGAVFCLDTDTGEMIWRLTAYPNYANNGLSRVVISEGHILYLDNHDNQIYCIGKGPSGTTVSAPQTVPALASSVTITGTVTDQSPSGRHNIAGDLDLPLKGTPAISDHDMDAWMEYMFHQRPKPATAKGVEVSLDTVDPNGNLVHIGNTTSDINGNFGLAYTPEVPGTYQIIATFGGSAAYGPSSATTYLTVGEAVPPPTQEPQAAAQPPLDMYLLFATVAIILSIAIVGLLILRKRP
jgi:outer membrane protein assembly factor BamB